MKTFNAHLILLFLFISGASAQEIIFSKPFKSEALSHSFLMGKVGKNYLVLEYSKQKSKRIVRVLDQKLQQLAEEKMLFLPAGAGVWEGNMISYDSFLLVTYTHRKGDILFLTALRMDENANPFGQLLVLDSVRVESKAVVTPWSIAHSKDKSKLLLTRVSYSSDSALLSTRVFNRQLELLQHNDSKLVIKFGHEIIGRLLISNGGEIYFPIYPAEPGSVVINKFEILSKPLAETFYRSVLVDLKNRYISWPANLTIDETKIYSNLFINSTYATGKKNEVVDGFFSARLDARSDKVKAVFNPLSDTLLFKHKGEKGVDFKFQVRLQNVFFLNNSGVMIVGELDKGRMLTVSQPRNYVNNVIINPRFNYSPVNYSRTYSGYYPQQGIYTNPEGYGPISYTEEYNKDIIVCYLDSSLKLQQQTVIVKKQSDMKKVSPIYLGFGTVNTSSAIHFLYREVKKAGGVIRNTSFSPSGKLIRLPPLKTFDDMYKLIPANAKQVGLREVIIPGTYRGKTFFAKIDL